MGPDEIDDDIRKIVRYEEWCNLVENSDSEADEAVSQGPKIEERGPIIS
jgi:hypothetical protein